MTEASPAVVTSKTEGRLFGFVEPGQPVPQAPKPRPTSDPAAVLRKAITAVNVNAHPAPFRTTKVSVDEMRQISADLLAVRDDLNVGRAPSRHSCPTLWTDGPLDFSMTALALLQRSAEHVPLTFTPSSKLVGEAWTKARDLVADLPKSLLSWPATSREAKGSLRKLTSNRLASWRSNRNTQQRQALPPELARVRNNQGPTDLAPFRTRAEPLVGLQALLGNSAGSRSRFDAVAERNRLGVTRGELAGVLHQLLIRLVQDDRANQRNWDNDLHGVFTMRNGSALADHFLNQELLRQIHGGNWTDPNHEVMLRTTGIAGHIAFNTLDLVCHLPSKYNPNASALRSKDLNELIDDPSCQFDDGTTFHLFDGIEINPDLVRRVMESPGELLKVGNVEQRRVLLRVLGHERLLQDIDAELVNEDEFGKLYSIPANNSQFVIVKNATPEPDGSVREYVLGTIGNRHVTARSGVASTWGLREDQYWPTRET